MPWRASLASSAAPSIGGANSTACWARAATTWWSMLPVPSRDRTIVWPSAASATACTISISPTTRPSCRASTACTTRPWTRECWSAPAPAPCPLSRARSLRRGLKAWSGRARCLRHHAGQRRAARAGPGRDDSRRCRQAHRRPAGAARLGHPAAHAAAWARQALGGALRPAGAGAVRAPLRHPRHVRGRGAGSVAFPCRAMVVVLAGAAGVGADPDAGRAAAGRAWPTGCASSAPTAAACGWNCRPARPAVRGA